MDRDSCGALDSLTLSGGVQGDWTQAIAAPVCSHSVEEKQTPQSRTRPTTPTPPSPDHDVNFKFPFHHLPVELISKCFIAGVPNPSVTRGRFLVDTSIRKYQVLVGSVCRSWREISHSTPQLWAVFLVNGCSGETSSFHDEMLEAILERSGSISLDVQLLLGFWKKFSPRALSVARKALGRALYLEVGLHSVYQDPTAFKTLFPLPPTPRLKHCFVYGSLRRISTDPQLDKLPLLDALCCMPELSTLQNEFQHTTLHLPNLTTTYLEDVYLHSASTTGSVSEFVSQSPMLRKLVIWMGCDTLDYDLASASLVRLSFLGDSSRLPLDPTTFPKLGRLPRLQHLTLQMNHRRLTREPPISWPNFPSLKSLTLSSVPEWKNHVIEILRGAPNLISIQLDDATAEVLLGAILPPYISFSCDPALMALKLRHLRITFPDRRPSWEDGGIDEETGEQVLECPLAAQAKRVIRDCVKFLDVVPTASVHLLTKPSPEWSNTYIKPHDRLALSNCYGLPTALPDIKGLYDV